MEISLDICSRVVQLYSKLRKIIPMPFSIPCSYFVWSACSLKLAWTYMWDTYTTSVIMEGRAEAHKCSQDPLTSIMKYLFWHFLIIRTPLILRLLHLMKQHIDLYKEFKITCHQIPNRKFSMKNVCKYLQALALSRLKYFHKLPILWAPKVQNTNVWKPL